MLESVHRQCPHCWEMIELLIDCSIEAQQYIEDCSVCCRPFEVHMTLEGEELWVELEASE